MQMKSEAGTNEQIKSERLKGMRRTRTGWVSAKTREGVILERCTSEKVAMFRNDPSVPLVKLNDVELATQQVKHLLIQGNSI